MSLAIADLEKLEYLNSTKFEGILHFAFDHIEDEGKIRQGLSILKGIKHQVQIYVLVGYPEKRWIDETDIARCQIIADAGFDPFIMVYNRKIRSSEPRMVHFRVILLWDNAKCTAARAILPRPA